jgi:hypothetical protein
VTNKSTNTTMDAVTIAATGVLAPVSSLTAERENEPVTCGTATTKLRVVTSGISGR